MNAVIVTRNEREKTQILCGKSKKKTIFPPNFRKEKRPSTSGVRNKIKPTLARIATKRKKGEEKIRVVSMITGTYPRENKKAARQCGYKEITYSLDSDPKELI